MLASNPAFAQIKANTIGDLTTSIEAHGCRQQLVRDEQLATLLVTCDEDIVHSDRDLRDHFFSREITDEFARAHRELLAAVFSESIAAKAMFLYYKTDSSLDQIVVIGNAVGYDDYGKPLDDITFTYGFSRELYTKVDPAHINPKKLRRIVKRWDSPELKLEND